YFRGLGFDKLNVSPILAAVNMRLPDFNALDFSKCVKGKDSSGKTINICTLTEFMPFDNAMYAPYDPNDAYSQQMNMIFGVDQDAIMFGLGARINYAYDADVIYHEFTHAVIGTVTNNAMINADDWGLVVEPGAVNEGMADYFSSTITNDSKTGNYARHATSSNSITMSPDAIRDVGEKISCPQDMWGEFHRDGGVISHAAWLARQMYMDHFKTADTFEFDRSLYDSMAVWGQVPYYADVVEAFVAAMSNNPKIGSEFAEKSREAFAVTNAGDCPRFHKLAKGEKKPLFFVPAFGGGISWPSYFQFAYDVPADAAGMKVVFTARDTSGKAHGGISLQMRSGQNVSYEWTADGYNVTSDTEVFPDENGEYILTAPDLKPGTTYYMVPTNSGDEAVIYNLNVVIEINPTEVDGGTPDGSVDQDASADSGTADPDASTDDAAIVDAGDPDASPDAGVADGAVVPEFKTTGCSCSTVAL
ncbi:MAG: hypothetical protein WC889_06800, partial [Myxococcota bacterium]